MKHSEVSHHEPISFLSGSKVGQNITTKEKNRTGTLDGENENGLLKIDANLTNKIDDSEYYQFTKKYGWTT